MIFPQKRGKYMIFIFIVLHWQRHVINVEIKAKLEHTHKYNLLLQHSLVIQQFIWSFSWQIQFYQKMENNTNNFTYDSENQPPKSKRLKMIRNDLLWWIDQSCSKSSHVLLNTEPPKRRSSGQIKFTICTRVLLQILKNTNTK